MPPEDSGIFSYVLSNNVQVHVAARLIIASIELTLVVLVVSLCLKFYRPRSSRFIAWIWVLVLLKPLMTLFIGPLVPVAQFQMRPPDPEFGATLFAQIDVAKNESVVQELERAQSMYLWNLNLKSAPGYTRTQGSSVLVSPLIGAFMKLLAFLWLGIIVFGAARVTLAGYSLRCIIRRGTEPDERLIQIYEGEARARGSEKFPQLKLSSEVESPVLFGAFRPYVLLPDWLKDSDPGVLQHVFAHELMHYKNRDALSLAVAHLTLLLFSFVPAAHRAFKEWLFHAELACDRALVRSESEAREYARELLDILERMQKRKGAESGLYATRFQLAQRMDALLDEPLLSSPNLTRPHSLALVAVALVVLGFGMRVHLQRLDFMENEVLMYGTTSGTSQPMTGLMQTAPE